MITWNFPFFRHKQSNAGYHLTFCCRVKTDTIIFPFIRPPLCSSHLSCPNFVRGVVFITNWTQHKIVELPKKERFWGWFFSWALTNYINLPIKLKMRDFFKAKIRFQASHICVTVTVPVFVHFKHFFNLRYNSLSIGSYSIGHLWIQTSN